MALSQEKINQMQAQADSLVEALTPVVGEKIALSVASKAYFVAVKTKS